MNILLIESTTPSFNNMIKTVSMPITTLVQLTIPLRAYMIRNHYPLELALSGPAILGIVPILFLKESTRWLIARGRLEEAKGTIKYIAKVNGKVDPGQLDISTELKEEKEKTNKSVFSLFKHKKMLLRTMICFFQWFVVIGNNYGLTYASVEVVGDPYLNLVILALISCPNFIFNMYLPDRLGRKWTLAVTQTMSGIFCLATGMMMVYGQVPGLQIFAVSVGKLFAGMAMHLMPLYCAEMYPTCLRATITGICTAIGKIGAIYAISLDGLKQHWEPLPFILIGGQAVLAGVLALTFPETTGCQLPETVEDALNNVGKNPKFRPWCSWDNKEDKHQQDTKLDNDSHADVKIE